MLESLVVRARSAEVSVLWTRTVAPGTTAPAGSVTVPLISPLPAVWANMLAALNARRAITAAIRLDEYTWCVLTVISLKLKYRLKLYAPANEGAHRRGKAETIKRTRSWGSK